MFRAAAILSALTTAAAMTAPAPVFRERPKSVSPWLTGWDEQADALKDCSFDRKTEKLTITIPERKPATTKPRAVSASTAPNLVREVEGDFDVEVRVFGAAPPVLRQGDFSRAGVFVSDGTCVIGRCSISPGKGWEKPCVLRIVRRGDLLTTQYFRDGKQFHEVKTTVKLLAKKLKVIVAAECDGRGGFKAEFDQFKLTTRAGATK